ncbi:zinc finger protein 888-like isoform X8 [Harpegnathos saltator]|uniref:zinc finger protein 888-like isoform X8 n=1 Tax=Harpegnathos saltator TaxID=610380 RepID=UPI000DBED8E3|nr:zinc finger protein 888-like isoform X8 [Harpegnathos saltator]
MSSADCSDLCRLCLVKERVTVPIFEGEGDARRIFTKISTCLPVKISREDKLPQKLCADCVYKVETFFEFWQTTAVSEKRLQAWLADVEKQDYAVATVLNQSGMKGEQSNENRLDGSGMMQQVSGHQNSLNMVMDNMGMCMSMMMPNNQQQITSVPMDPSGSSVQSIQVVAGSSTHEQITHDQIIQNQTNAPTQQEEEEESSEDEENSDDECDGDGLPIKEESEEDPNNSRTIEPTTFVNVSLACEDPGPSGLQQQKMADIQEMTTAGDPKTGKKPIIWQRGRRKRVHLLILDSWKSILGNDPANKKIAEISSISSISSIRIQCENAEETVITDPLAEDSQKLEESVEYEQLSSPVVVDTSTATAQQESDPPSRKEHTIVDEALDRIRNICPFCDKRFDSAKKVENHVKYVHRKPYKCDKCKRSCYTQRALNEHKRIHRSDYFFECDICHVKYKSMYGLKRHYIRNHSDHESRYICEHCGRSYKLQIDLTHHMKRTHSSLLQICRFCGKAVKDVKGHEWRHQRRTREIKYDYSCHLCRKKFLHKNRLDSHLKLHEKGYKCEQCDKEFIGTRQLLSHKRFKHGHANISTCILCKKTFTSVSNFYQHVLTHAGIRPYKCDICEEDFTQRSSLLRHRKHHPGPLPPMQLTHPQIAELARSYLQKVQPTRPTVDESSDSKIGR